MTRRRIQVLHLIDSLDLGGAQTALLGWLQTHQREVFAVELAVFHGSPRSLFYQRARDLGIPIHFLAGRRYTPEHVLRLAGIMMIRRFDVVHCHLFVSNWIGKPLAKFCRVPAVVSHDQCNDESRIKHPWVRFVDTAANRFADLVFAVSPTIRDFLVEREKVAAEKVIVLPNGVNHTAARTTKPASNKLRIGSAGRFVSQKNFDRFLRIAGCLKKLDPAYSFILAGSGPLEPELRVQAKELDLEIRWLVGQSDLTEFFASVDLFLLTSRFEGLPMVVLEAMQQRIPVAAFPVDGLRQLEREILVLPIEDDDQQCAARVHRFWNDPDGRNQLVKKAAETVATQYSSEKQMREIEAVYQRLLGMVN